MLDDYCAGADEDAAARLEGPEDEALDRLRAWLRMPEGGVDRLGCLLAKATAELAWENEAVVTRALATFETLLDSCRQLVEQAQRAGHVDPVADAEVLGGLIVTTHRGLEAMAKAGVDTKTLNRIADAAIDNIALKALSRGVGPGGPHDSSRVARSAGEPRNGLMPRKRTPRQRRAAQQRGRLQ